MAKANFVFSIIDHGNENGLAYGIKTVCWDTRSQGIVATDYNEVTHHSAALRVSENNTGPYVWDRVHSQERPSWLPENF